MLSIALRGSALISKFALLFLLAYFLEPKDVALYGLLVATVGYCIYGLGFDFYVYSTRELLGASHLHWARLLRDQGMFFIVTYAIVLPLLFVVFVLDLLPWTTAPWFFFLVVLEHLGQELNRLLVAMSRQLYASCVHFLRGGLWALIVALCFWKFPSSRSLEFVLSAWVVGATIACFVGFLVIYKLDRNCLKQPVDWRWVKRGLKIAFPFLLATLAVRGMFTFDRYWIEITAGENVLASYVLFAGVASTVTAFLDAGVFVFSYPKLIVFCKEKDCDAFSNGMRILLIQTSVISFLLSVLAAALIHPVLMLIGKDIYIENVGILYVMLGAIFIYAISMVPHYGLYAMSQDAVIIKIHLLSFVLFLLISAFFTVFMPVYGVPLALCGTFFAMVVGKTIAYIKFREKQEWSVKGRNFIEYTDG
ncbi:hypothetical protein [Halomonas sp. MMSF_3323]|uniref:hypothetical protein n=1 Tax=Halomonas sp. MMSF_3323 TaxID=3046701 RepID=UPI0027400520|nr:hypothetical protein [Halomonas sp. MMSF_3323]